MKNKEDLFFDFNLLKKICISNITFLSIREKLIFEKYLDSISENQGFDSMLKKIELISKDEISEIVERKIPRASWNGTESIKTALLSKKIVEKFSIKSVFYGEKNYPVMLTEMAGVKDSPYSLFYRGNLDILKNPCISVVGTRRATLSARKAAFDFAKAACDDGKTIISGLAFGIDIEAHKGALESTNPATVAVLPSGIDTIVPSSHSKYAAKILEKNGLIVSEYIPGTPAEKFRFVQRNRIVAALSPSTLIVQAPAGSGSMITADLALGYNRNVVFHSVNFELQSLKLDEIVKNQLLKDVQNGIKSKNNVDFKIENSPKSYIESGAKIITSYIEYKKI